MFALQDVQLQNAGAWANLTAAAPAAVAGGAAQPAAPAAGAEAGPGEDDDNLWTEFQGREAQQLQVGLWAVCGTAAAEGRMDKASKAAEQGARTT